MNVKTFIIKFHVIICTCFLSNSATPQGLKIELENLPYKLYPDVNNIKPDLASPFTSTTGDEFVIAVTINELYAIIPVTLSDNREICRQLIVDTQDFPGLAKNGLHSEQNLSKIKFITGRALTDITELGRPGNLSHAGFMAMDETILSVIRADNNIVKNLGLTHPQLAKPLFHVLNMIDTDLSLDRWNMARHRWENIQYFFYNNRKVFVQAEDTKGGQKSIFDDEIQGAFYIKLWHDFDEGEIQFLKKKYSHLTTTQFDSLKTLLSVINTGEIQPQYIMRYGFYEGHTFWRTDPIAISFIFGLKNLSEIEKDFKGELFHILTSHFTEKKAVN